MSDRRVRLLGLLFVAAVGCTLTPPAHNDAGASSGASSGAASGAASGSRSGAGPGGASAGTGAAVGASSNGGTTTNGPSTPDSAGAGDGGAGAAGDTTTEGGADAAGGSSGCVPECDRGMVCTSGSCACPAQQSACSKACVDLQTDPANCGACGHACTDKCGRGHCFRELTGVPTAESSAVNLAADATYVYFTRNQEGTVSRVPRKGGSAVILASSQDSPRTIAVDATNVYWANEPATYGAGSVMKLALSGGDPTPLATGEPSPAFIAVGANKVYWSNYPPQPPIFMSVPIAGGAKTEFPTGNELGNSVQFSLDGSSLYWAGWYDKGGVWSTPLDGGGPIKPLATVDSYASNAVVFGNNVYFLAGGPTVPSMLKKVSTSGGTASDVVALSGGYLNVDATGIYVGGATPEGGVKNSIVRVSFDGGTVTTLAVAASALYTFAFGDTEVFWVDRDLKIKAAAKNP